jgi:hypothetical protein
MALLLSFRASPAGEHDNFEIILSTGKYVEIAIFHFKEK